MAHDQNKESRDEARVRLARLRVRWDGSPLGYLLEVLEPLLDGPDPRVGALAAEALGADGDAGTLLQALTGPFFAALRSDDWAAYPSAVRAVSKMSDHGVDLAPVVGALARIILAGQDAGAPCRALLWAGQRGCDLSAARPALEMAMGDPSDPVRHSASEALSLELRRSGEEEALRVRSELTPGAGWHLQASHRRIWAASDAPLADAPDTCLYEPRRPCVVCGSSHTHCIYYGGWSDLTGSEHQFEYRCADCGRYSLYDWSH